VDSGAILAEVYTGQYPRITGIATIIGSAKIRLRTSVDSGGPYLVSSNWAINSGPTYLDSVNYGHFHTIDVTAANSQAGSFLLTGEPAR
jgi:hypothetical protein